MGVVALFGTPCRILYSIYVGAKLVTGTELLAPASLVWGMIKKEVGCRDDTMPKTVDTRRHCNNLPQPPKTKGLGCRRLLHALTPLCSAFLYLGCGSLLHALTPPCSAFLYPHGIIPTSYFIFNDFCTCFTNFVSRFSI